jgi:hypothetical protein
MHSLPENSWILYREVVDKADKALYGILDNKPMGPLLNQFIHMLVFQQGISVARWIVNNQDLVGRLNAVQSFTKDEFEILAAEVKESVAKLMRI